MNLSSIFNMIGGEGGDWSDFLGGFSGGEGGATGGWDYWAKAIQDSVIGQSAGFDAVKQNQESEPLALQATGGTPTNGPTRGTYKYNFEGQVPFLQGLGSALSSNRTNDPLYKKDIDKITKNAQNNASGSNGALDTSLNEDARKVAGISEGGAKPQFFATSMPKNQSFNSMMDSFENISLPMDNPKNRQGGLMGMLGKETNKDKKDGLDTASPTTSGIDTDTFSDMDWDGIMDWFSNLFGSSA